ncbi:hypothetical protein OF83DRAFT_1157945 [Amylostereum chailletii]|nr:hypothetical protein OF83DRAFT_1157945 [Amylostereum chailletii]
MYTTSILWHLAAEVGVPIAWMCRRMVSSKDIPEAQAQAKVDDMAGNLTAITLPSPTLAVTLRRAPYCPADLFRWTICEIDSAVRVPNTKHPHGPHCLPNTIYPMVCYTEQDDWPTQPIPHHKEQNYNYEVLLCCSCTILAIVFLSYSTIKMRNTRATPTTSKYPRIPLVQPTTTSPLGGLSTSPPLEFPDTPVFSRGGVTLAASLVDTPETATRPLRITYQASFKPQPKFAHCRDTSQFVLGPSCVQCDDSGASSSSEPDPFLTHASVDGVDNTFETERSPPASQLLPISDSELVSGSRVEPASAPCPDISSTIVSAPPDQDHAVGEIVAQQQLQPSVADVSHSSESDIPCGQDVSFSLVPLDFGSPDSPQASPMQGQVTVEPALDRSPQSGMLEDTLSSVLSAPCHPERLQDAPLSPATSDNWSDSEPSQIVNKLPVVDRSPKPGMLKALPSFVLRTPDQQEQRLRDIVLSPTTSANWSFSGSEQGSDYSLANRGFRSLRAASNFLDSSSSLDR